MEPLAAIGLAGNITQFVDFGLQLCRTMTQIYRSASGSTKQNDDIEILINNFSCNLYDIERDLSKYCTYLSDDATTEGEKSGEGDVHAVVDGCRRITTGLPGRLNTLKVGN
jgi:hypothetical protein